MRIQNALNRLPVELVSQVGNNALDRLSRNGHQWPRELYERLACLKEYKWEERKALYATAICTAVAFGVFPADPADWGREVVVKLWPRACAHLICHSLGYATPHTAASILADAKGRRENWCEWLAACWGSDAYKCVKAGLSNEGGFSPRRERHSGYMADYGTALELVRAVAEKGSEPMGMLASWF